MNLFWETRKLTQKREDHLTYFIAAALEVDRGFRAAYETSVLAPLAVGSAIPRIQTVTTQLAFPEQRSQQPDMMLVLGDGRRVICEHKLDAPETVQENPEGEILLQLERYLELPDVAAVIYFRSCLKPPEDLVLAHPRYCRPVTAPHYLWRDLYEPLTKGSHTLSTWLREGFEKLGFTPPLPHVGELWPDTGEEVKQNQRNFAKLWHRVRSDLSDRWKIETGRRCELYLKPKGLAPVTQVYVSPLAQAGSLLRVRFSAALSSLEEVRHRLEAGVPNLQVQPTIERGAHPDGTLFIDLVAPLWLVLGHEAIASDQEARLYRQVVPVVDAMTADA